MEGERDQQGKGEKEATDFLDTLVEGFARTFTKLTKGP